MLRSWYLTPLLAGLGCVLAACTPEEQATSLPAATSSPSPSFAQPAPLTVPVPRSLDDALKAAKAESSHLREKTLAAADSKVSFAQPAPIASSKPALEVYRTGLEHLLDSQANFRSTLQEQGMTDEQINTYLGCIVDQTHSSMSPQFLNNVAPGKSADAIISQEDQETLNKAIDHCSTQW